MSGTTVKKPVLSAEFLRALSKRCFSAGHHLPTLEHEVNSLFLYTGSLRQKSGRRNDTGQDMLSSYSRLFGVVIFSSALVARSSTVLSVS